MAPSDASPRPQHRPVVRAAASVTGATPATPASSASSAVPQAQAGPRPTLPGGGRRVFAGGRFLVAYYGTAGSGALGVLGEDPPDRMDARLTRAARAFGSPRQPVQKVYE